MLRTSMYGGLVFAIVATLWAYAGQLSSSSRQRILRPDYPMTLSSAKASLTVVPPWAAGDVDIVIEDDLNT